MSIAHIIRRYTNVLFALLCFSMTVCRSNMVPRLPGTSAVRPHTQFSYPRYCGTTYTDSPYSDDKKFSVCRRSLTWKCAALVLLLIVISLVGVVAYLLGTSRPIHNSFDSLCLKLHGPYSRSRRPLQHRELHKHMPQVLIYSFEFISAFYLVDPAFVSPRNEYSVKPKMF